MNLHERAGQQVLEETLQSLIKLIYHNRFGDIIIIDNVKGRGVRMDGNRKIIGPVPRDNEPDAERQPAPQPAQPKVSPVTVAIIVVAIIIGVFTPKGSSAY
ncbi:MAG: hypothetical protein EOO42_23635 [Flavobacteriales bacterium]|nr:MAG: hypothetical protein EOO42_23635 [Flavobacteriales bacterium]